MSYTWRFQLNIGPHHDVYKGSVQLGENNFTNSQVDELVISPWFHLEAMDDNQYYLRIGSRAFNVVITDGEASMFDQETGEALDLSSPAPLG
jgi:hypothetical protein